jgi:hypothetical protein
MRSGEIAGTALLQPLLMPVSLYRFIGAVQLIVGTAAARGDRRAGRIVERDATALPSDFSFTARSYIQLRNMGRAAAVTNARTGDQCRAGRCRLAQI